MRRKEAKGLIGMSAFEVLFTLCFVLAPTVYNMPELDARPEMKTWSVRLTFLVLGLITPAMNLCFFKFEKLRRHQDRWMFLGGIILFGLEAFVLSLLPSPIPRVVFGLHTIIVVAVYMTPGQRYSYSRALAWCATMIFAGTYLSIREYPTVSGHSYAMVVMFVMANLAGMLLGRERDRMLRELFINSMEIDAERRQSQRLIENVLPRQVAAELAGSVGAKVAKAIPDASILFADIVGFTTMSRNLPARTLIDYLSYLFSRFDALSEEFQVEKIKTIGDAYMAAGGLPEHRHDHLQSLVRVAFKMHEEMVDFRREFGLEVHLRIGIDVGAVVAGVLGTKKFSYDLWGETVNLASRLEASAAPGTVHVSDAVAQALRGDFEVRERGTFDLKGFGQTQTYVVVGPATQKAAA